MYGKIIDGIFHAAPYSIVCKLTVNGRTKPFRVFSPSDEQYISAGYLPVIEAERPIDVVYACTYTERDGKIYESIVPLEVPTAAPSELETRVSECEDALVELAEIISTEVLANG